MVTGLCWFVPGLVGSELYLVTASGLAYKRWLDPIAVFTGSVLDDLTWGNNPAGSRMVAGRVLEMFGYGYPGLLTNLQRQLGPLGYTINGWPYDFRDTVMNSGTQLANAIASYGSLANGHLLVTHSMGGLVAQVAMAVLKQNGLDKLVKGVCAICPPFSGSYSTVHAWREEEDGPNLLALANATSIGGLGRALFGANLVSTQGLAQNRLKALACFESWPSTYDLLPDPLKADDPGDDWRALVWNLSNWNTCLVIPSQTLLTQAQGVTRPFLAANPPDPARWTVVMSVAENERTANRLTLAPTQGYIPGSFPAILGNPDLAATLRRRATLPGLSYSDQGDGRVTLASQNVYNLPFMLIRADHDDAATHPAVLGNIAALLGVGSVKRYPTAALSPAWPSPVA